MVGIRDDLGGDDAARRVVTASATLFAHVSETFEPVSPTSYCFKLEMQSSRHASKNCPARLEHLLLHSFIAAEPPSILDSNLETVLRAVRGQGGSHSNGRLTTKSLHPLHVPSSAGGGCQKTCLAKKQPFLLFTTAI